MSAKTVAQTLSNRRRTIIRYRWIAVLATLSALAGFAAYGLISRPITATLSAPVPLVQPTVQPMPDYFQLERIIASLQPTASALDPAQQATMAYLRAHGVKQTARVAPWDPAVQAVLDYLRAHSR